MENKKEIDISNFDWKSYIDYYKDLGKAGINNAKKAWKHWEFYGNKEGRKCFYLNDHIEPLIEPVIESVIEPVIESVIEPVVESVVEPVVESVVEPVVESVIEPVVEPVVDELLIEIVTDSDVESVIEPIIELNDIVPVEIKKTKKSKKIKKNNINEIKLDVIEIKKTDNIVLNIL